MTPTHTKIAEHMIEAGYAKDFIAIALGMLDDPRCDLDGRVSDYANDLAALMKKAIHEMEEEIPWDAWVVVEYKYGEIYDIQGVYATSEDAERFVISQGEDPVNSERYQIRGYQRDAFKEEEE